MPQVLAAIGGWAAVGTFVAKVGVTFLLTKLATPFAPKNRGGSNSQDFSAREITIRGTVEPRQMIYGQVRTSGVLAWIGCSGTNNLYLWYAVVLAGHECAEISDCWLDSQQIPNADINSTTGVVSTSVYNGKLRIWKRLGANGQLVDPNLDSAFTEWTNAFKGTGVAYVVYRLERDATVWPNGAPQNFFSLVKGRKLYDPRLDSTNGGSGSHRFNDAATWAWSSNWALVVRDYISGGSVKYYGAPTKVYGTCELDSRIDDAYTMAAANKADESVTIPSSTQPRYTCDIQLSCGDEHAKNLQKLLSAGAGKLVYCGGKYRIFAGAYDTPTVTLTADDILGPIQVATSPSTSENYNRVSGTFYDEDRNWTQNTFPTRANAAYEAEDGDIRPQEKTIELSGTRTNYRAQRIAELILKQSRLKTTVRFTKLSPVAAQIGEWDTFEVELDEYDWNPIVLRCLEWEFDPEDGLISITARNEDSAVYTDPTSGEYLTAATAGYPTSTVDGIDAPTNFTAQGTSNGILFKWDNPAFINFVIELYEGASGVAFSSATKIWEGKASGKYIVKSDVTVRHYWIRARSADLQYSAAVPGTAAGSGLPASAATSSSSLSASVSPSSFSVSQGNSSYTTGLATVSPSGGTAPYSYSWAWNTGGSGITINSPTSSGTTFTASGLSAGGTFTGQARCTVTDNIGATFIVYVTVSISRTVLSASMSPSSISVSDSASTITTGAATVTASNGQPSYTYAWSWQSGGSGITINSTSASATTFTASSMSVGTLSGTAQCVVTDSLGQTTTVTVGVSITRTAIIDEFSLYGGAYYTGEPSFDMLVQGYLDSAGGFGSFGSLTPNQDHNGYLITAIIDWTVAGGGPRADLNITNFGSDPGQSYFASIRVVSAYDDVTLTSAAASYSYGSGTAVWQWSSTAFEVFEGVSHTVYITF